MSSEILLINSDRSARDLAAPAAARYRGSKPRLSSALSRVTVRLDSLKI